MAWCMQQLAYFVELVCDFLFYRKRTDRRQLEVAFAEGLSSEFQCSDRSPASVLITPQFNLPSLWSC